MISQTSFSRIENRLDAEFFKPEFIDTESVIENLKHNNSFRVIPLRDVAKKVRKGIFSILKTEYKKDGVPFIRVGNIKGLFIDHKDMVYISEEKNEAEKKTCLHPRDIVVSKGGTIGEVAIIPQKMPRANISQDVICISIYEKKVPPEYVVAYLASKFGKIWFERNRSRQTHPHLTLEPVRDMLVPIPSKIHQEKVMTMINTALMLIDEADRDYTQANDMLLASLSLEDDVQKVKTQTVNYSDVLKHDRLDSDFFTPKFTNIEKILEHKKNEGQIELKNLHEIAGISRGTEVGSKSYLNQGEYTFLRVSNLSEFGVKIKNSTKYIRKYLYDQLSYKYQPRKKEILYSKDGTIGISLVVETDFPRSIICSGIVRIRPKRNLDPYYLSLVLNSIACRSQAERHAIGTVIKHLPIGALQKLKIPFVSNKKQKRISELVQKSMREKKNAKSIVSDAISYVESLLNNSSLEAS